MTDSPSTDPQAPVEHSSMAAALAAFQGDMPVVRKDKTARVQTRSGGEYSYSYADLAAIFQVLQPDCAHRIAKLILTASGGPFRTWTREAMEAATLGEGRGRRGAPIGSDPGAL